MPDAKITALTAISVIDVAADVLPIVDISDTSMAASGTTKKITINQILGASGIATLASATITGNLTVDTNTLFVDSVNNRVIVGHTSGASAFQVSNAGAAGFEVQPTGVNSAPAILSYNRSGAAWIQLTYGASSHVWQNSGTDAMTLNATGLGVGASPGSRLDVRFPTNPAVDNAGGSHALRVWTAATQAADVGGQLGLGGLYDATNYQSFAAVSGKKENATSGNNAGYFSVATCNSVGTMFERMRIDSVGNLILSLSATPPTLTVNGQLTVNATSNTNLRFSYRGSDGTTRVANLTLA